MINADVKMLLARLEEKGHQAYVVGGAVRNYLLGREISDYDLTTGARPDEIKEIFSDYTTVDVGSAYGTIVVLIGSKSYEITTFRSEGDYDGRRPGRVEFSSSLEEDLKRRDFTINAMAYNPKTGIIDRYKGKDDLKAGLIKAIGNPADRMAEDYLRMVRAIRFASQLDFEIDSDLSGVIREMKDKLRHISVERIRDEFNKIILADRPSRGIGLLFDHGILEILSKDLYNMVGFDQRSTFHDLDLYSHTMKTLDHTEPVLELRLAALFHDVGKPEAFFIDDEGEGRFYGHQNISGQIVKDFMTQYKYPSLTIKRVVNLVERHMDNVNTYTHKSIKKLMTRMEGDLGLLFDLQEADVRATNQEVNLGNVNLGRALVEEIKEKKMPTKKKDLAINGGHLLKLGFKQGKEVGEVLDHLLELVIEDPSLNTKNKLLKIAKNHIGGRL